MNRLIPFLFTLWTAAIPNLEGGERPNLLLIVADDLGYSDLGCYGGEIRTPNLDALAAKGLRLTSFYNTGRCCPSRVSLLTGQYPHRVGLGHMIQDLNLPGYRGRVSPQNVTLAEVLRPAGYRCFLSGKWHLGTPDPTRHGFEEFYGTLVSAKTFWDPDHLIRRPEGRQARRYPPGTFYATDAVTDHALDFLNLARETPDRPWFLYLAFNAPHFPLHAPEPDIARYRDRYLGGWDQLRAERLDRMKKLGLIPEGVPLPARSPYWNWGEEVNEPNPAWESLPGDRRQDLARRMAIFAAMVDRMDQNVGRVLADLRRAGELDNTLIVFLSDNGACAEWDPFGFDGKSGPYGRLHTGQALESMGGPGTYHSVGSGWANASNTPFRLYKHFNHEGGIRSPCILHWPAGLPRFGDMDPTPAHLIDVMATFSAVAEAQYPAAAHGQPLPPMPGVSLAPLFQGGSLPERALYFEHEANRAIRRGPWKAVALKDGPWELYHLETDPNELQDQAAARPEILAQLVGEWETWARRARVTPAPRDFGVDYLKPRTRPWTGEPASGPQSQ